MKILTNKQYQRELEKEIRPLKLEIQDLNTIISNKEFEYLNDKCELEKQNEELLKVNQAHQDIIVEREHEIKRLEEENKELKEKLAKNTGARGGLTKQVHKLEQELADANEKLSQRYILKELAPQKSKNTQVMKTKSSSKTSNIIKKVVEDD